VLTDTVEEIVYVADPVTLVVYPVSRAIACSVPEAETATGPLYTLDEVVGVVPFVV
jgi:hypothetical protein